MYWRRSPRCRNRIALWLLPGSVRSLKLARQTLSSKTWYGQPAYARDGKIICFFQPAEKFKTEVLDARLQ